MQARLPRRRLPACDATPSTVRSIEHGGHPRVWRRQFVRVSGGNLEVSGALRVRSEVCGYMQNCTHTRVPLSLLFAGGCVCVCGLSASLSLADARETERSRRAVSLLSRSRVLRRALYVSIWLCCGHCGIWGLTAPPWLVTGGWRSLPGPGPARAPPRAPRGRRGAARGGARAARAPPRVHVCVVGVPESCCSPCSIIIRTIQRGLADAKSLRDT